MSHRGTVGIWTEAELLACQQKGIGGSLAVPLLKRFELGQGLINDGQHHSYAVVVEPRFECFFFPHEKVASNMFPVTLKEQFF